MTITTEDACRAILSLIHSDIAGLDIGYDVWDKLDELESKSSLSRGEQALVGVARSVWAGTSAFGIMDRANADAVLGILHSFYVGTKS